MFLFSDLFLIVICILNFSKSFCRSVSPFFQILNNIVIYFKVDSGDQFSVKVAIFSNYLIVFVPQPR